MSTLTQENCIRPTLEVPSLSETEVDGLTPQVPEWNIFAVDGIQRMERAFKFKNFVQALAFTNRVGELAEEQDHHPALLTEWGKVSVTWWTHAVGGLHRNDFIMSAKTDELYKG
jgi:4a-hydroxytetrahydrobiopterin dehydratase